MWDIEGDELLFWSLAKSEAWWHDAAPSPGFPSPGFTKERVSSTCRTQKSTQWSNRDRSFWDIWNYGKGLLCILRLKQDQYTSYVNQKVWAWNVTHWTRLMLPTIIIFLWNFEILVLVFTPETSILRVQNGPIMQCTYFVANYYRTNQIQNWFPSLPEDNFLRFGLWYQAHQGTLVGKTLYRSAVCSKPQHHQDGSQNMFWGK